MPRRKTMHAPLVVALGATALLASTTIVGLAPRRDDWSASSMGFSETIAGRVQLRANEDEDTLEHLRNCPPTGNDSDGRTQPQPGPPPLPGALRKSTYAVSFPGSGDVMITKTLVERLTGMHVGEADDSPLVGRGRGEVVAVRTHFPHVSGMLASWDEDIPRAFIVLRSPLHAIPGYFNQLYETRNNLPAGAATLPEHASASRAAWIEWRDSGDLHKQILSYRRFVSVWMENFLGKYQGRRAYFAYEELVDEGTGPHQAARLAKFLNRGVMDSAVDWATSNMKRKDIGDVDGLWEKGMSIEELVKKVKGATTETMVRTEDVPCLWKEVVQEGIRQTDSSDWNPIERPYTAADLVATSGMLLELMNRWSRFQHLLNILSVYNREARHAYLTATGELTAVVEQRHEFDFKTKSALGHYYGGDKPLPKGFSLRHKKRVMRNPSEYDVT